MAQPLLPTPKIVSQGSISKPRPQPKPRGLVPKLAAPKLTKAPTNRVLNY
jgi:hypothetical protein